MTEVRQFDEHISDSSHLYLVVDDISDTALIANTVCAFLNSESGGNVYVPINSGFPQIEEKDDELRRYSNLCETVREMIDPPTLYSMSVRDSESGKLLVIDVPSGADKPYLSNGSFWINDDRKIRTAGRTDLNQMIDYTSLRARRWERRKSLVEEEDIDYDLVQQVRIDAEKSGRLALDRNVQLPLEILRDLSYWSPGGFTNAGTVLFGKYPERWLPQVRSHILFVNDKKTDDEIFSDWHEGSSLTNVKQMYRRLTSMNLSKSYFNGNSLSRTDIPKYDPFVLREALVNAIVHRDYTALAGGLTVTVYHDKIEFWNPGQLNENLSLDDLTQTHQSFPNNPDIAYAFFLCGYMDRIGRGTQKIVETCKNLGAPLPVWKQDSSGVTLTVYASFTER